MEEHEADCVAASDSFCENCGEQVKKDMSRVEMVVGHLGHVIGTRVIFDTHLSYDSIGFAAVGSRSAYLFGRWRLRCSRGPVSDVRGRSEPSVESS